MVFLPDGSSAPSTYGPVQEASAAPCVDTADGTDATDSDAGASRRAARSGVHRRLCLTVSAVTGLLAAALTLRSLQTLGKEPEGIVSMQPAQDPWVLVGGGKGCSNWRVSAIGKAKEMKPQTVTACGEACGNQSGCMAFGFQPKAGSGHEQMGKGYCYMWSELCHMETNKWWDNYRMRSYKQLPWALHSTRMGCSNYKSIQIQQTTEYNANACGLVCEKVNGCVAFNFQPGHCEHPDHPNTGQTHKGACSLFKATCSTEINPCWDYYVMQSSVSYSTTVAGTTGTAPDIQFALSQAAASGDREMEVNKDPNDPSLAVSVLNIILVGDTNTATFESAEVTEATDNGNTITIKVARLLKHGYPAGAPVTVLMTSLSTTARATAPFGQSFLDVDDVSLWNAGDSILIAEQKPSSSKGTYGSMTNYILSVDATTRRFNLHVPLPYEVAAGARITKIGTASVTPAPTASTASSQVTQTSRTGSKTLTVQSASVFGPASILPQPVLISTRYQTTARLLEEDDGATERRLSQMTNVITAIDISTNVLTLQDPLSFDVDAGSTVSVIVTAAPTLAPTAAPTSQPTAAECRCDNPKSSVAGQNGYSCTDGSSFNCASSAACLQTDTFAPTVDPCGALAQCKCDSPSAGMAGQNGYTCNDGNKATCASHEYCASTDEFPEPAPGQSASACSASAGSTPSPTAGDQCNCDAPNSGTNAALGENTYTCSGTAGNGNCASNEICFATTAFDPSLATTAGCQDVVTCQCTTPNLGHSSGQNAYSCSDTSKNGDCGTQYCTKAKFEYHDVATTCASSKAFEATQLSADASNGANSITVTDASGFAANANIDISDGTNEQVVTISSISGTTFSISPVLQQSYATNSNVWQVTGVTCNCDSPNVGNTAGLNDYTCSDGSTGSCTVNSEFCIAATFRLDAKSSDGCGTTKSWSATQLSAVVAASATSLAVADATGFTAGGDITITAPGGSTTQTVNLQSMSGTTFTVSPGVTSAYPALSVVSQGAKAATTLSDPVASGATSLTTSDQALTSLPAGSTISISAPGGSPTENAEIASTARRLADARMLAGGTITLKTGLTSAYPANSIITEVSRPATTTPPPGSTTSTA